jgi:hypothetical protein
VFGAATISAGDPRLALDAIQDKAFHAIERQKQYGPIGSSLCEAH